LTGIKGSESLLSHLHVIASRDSGVAISMLLCKLQEIASVTLPIHGFRPLGQPSAVLYRSKRLSRSQ